ncbi:hypothetical protein B0T19DRAFT_220642 [Cercophora scortea]|uniref:Secreted protein n=1 Tax=Cercophora scortea TaxID=314031 RepID=A0AAE0M9M8_9PEZI|nr:hypothetical protein B0T19DRAFT_220642 [Cercophora scortea]
MLWMGWGTLLSFLSFSYSHAHTACLSLCVCVCVCGPRCLPDNCFSCPSFSDPPLTMFPFRTRCEKRTDGLIKFPAVYFFLSTCHPAAGLTTRRKEEATAREGGFLILAPSPTDRKHGGGMSSYIYTHDQAYEMGQSM